VRQDFGALVAEDFALFTAPDPRDRRELVQLLPVDREAVEDPLGPLPDLERGEAQGGGVRHGSLLLLLARR